LAQNPDLAAARAAGNLPSPFQHYKSQGMVEGRRASPWFDERFYRLANGDVAAAIAAGGVRSGLEHFLMYGQYQNRVAIPYFGYLAANPHIATPGVLNSPYAAFLAGATGDPSVWFSEAHYLAYNPDVASAVSAHVFKSGLEHYLRSGRTEGRRFSPVFSEASYRLKNPDIAAAISAGTLGSAFEYYILIGQYENRPM
jgi:hypothetical protein